MGQRLSAHHHSHLHNQELRVIDIEDPKPLAAGEVLLQLQYVGFCGSDLNTFRGRNTMALNPIIPGHEVGAVIEAVGDGVPDSLKPGMMVTSYTVNTMTDPVHQRLQEITGGFGPDVVVEAVGSVPTYQMAVEEGAFTGRVACIGYAKSEVAFQTKLFVQKELDIRGSRNATPQDFRAVIRYLERGTCPTDQLITKVIAPDEAMDTMQWWDKHPGKVFRILVEWGR